MNEDLNFRVKPITRFLDGKHRGDVLFGKTNERFFARDDQMRWVKNLEGKNEALRSIPTIVRDGYETKLFQVTDTHFVVSQHLQGKNEAEQRDTIMELIINH